MTLEAIPIAIGLIVGLVGLVIVADAWTPDDMEFHGERRRAARTERSRGGEALIGLGVMCMGAAFVGRDTWVYCIVAVIAGAVLLVLGALVNRHFLRDLVANRGPYRRRERY